MTFESFKKSLSDVEPPISLRPILRSLWYAGKGDWNSSHNIAQDISNWEGSWVHAYLHREEGDTWNANYWYRRAGKSMPNMTIEDEWEAIVKALLT